MHKPIIIPDIIIGSGSIRYVFRHQIYIDDPHVQSFTAYVLLKDKLLLQDIDFQLAQKADWERVEFSRAYLKKRLAQDGELICAYCGKRHLQIEDRGMRVDDIIKATVDHIVPISKGGSPELETNIVVACYRCNNKKGNKDLHDFIKQLEKVPQWVKQHI